MKQVLQLIFTKYFLLVSLCISSSISFANDIEGAFDDAYQENFHSIKRVSIDTAIKAFDSVWKFSHKTEGSGFFTSPNLLVTNLHVVVEAIQKGSVNELSLENASKSKSVKVKQVLAISAEMDLALLKIEESVSDYLPIRTQTLDDSKTQLAILGYPINNPMYTPIGLLRGHPRIMRSISQIHSSIQKNRLFFNVNYEHLAGLSGGPVIDSQGQVVAVSNSSIDNTLEATIIKEFIQEFEKFSCKGKTTKTCLKDSLDLLHQRAREGIVSAQFQLGFLYYDSPFFNPDEKKAKTWLSLAAEQGHPIAQYLLGAISSEYEGNIEKAIPLLKRAEEQNFAPAIYQLAKIKKKQGNRDESIALLWKAGNTNYEPALNDLLDMLKKTEDYAEEAEKAGSAGHYLTLYKLAMRMLNMGDTYKAKAYTVKHIAQGHLPGVKPSARDKAEKDKNCKNTF